MILNLIKKKTQVNITNINQNIIDKKDIIQEFKKNPKVNNINESNYDFIKGNNNYSQSFIKTLIGNINKECIDNNCEIISNN